jgi:hypothetical protein
MSVRLVLSKDPDEFTQKYDFTEGIVSEIKWASNLLDLLISVYYYWDIPEEKSKNKVLTIRFMNSQEAVFTMPKVFDSIPKNNLPNYIYSWYTITGVLVSQKDNLFYVEIKTIDSNPPWLTLKCENIWIEGEA